MSGEPGKGTLPPAHPGAPSSPAGEAGSVGMMSEHLSPFRRGFTMTLIQLKLQGLPSASSCSAVPRVLICIFFLEEGSHIFISVRSDRT